MKLTTGHGFSVFASDNGIVMTCGDGSLGKFRFTTKYTQTRRTEIGILGNVLKAILVNYKL